MGIGQVAIVRRREPPFASTISAYSESRRGWIFGRRG